MHCYRMVERQGCGQSSSCWSSGWFETQEGVEQVVVVPGFAPGGGDVVAAVLADDSELGVTEGGQAGGAVAGADLGGIFTQRSVADPVDLVLYAPVRPDVGG